MLGQRLPPFTLQDENGEDFDSEMLSGLRWVLFFFPRAGTPGCTQESLDFSALHAVFMSMNVPVMGVSSDSPAKLLSFKEKNSLKVKLLSDPEQKLQESLGVWGLKKSFGKEYMGTIRSTFVIGPDGRIEAEWRNLRVKGHADAVLKRVRELHRPA